jgi:pyruvate/2-oxoglutarate dehydrogenase complex dihydrolipoamide acyltransferase (E2) component
MAEVAAVTNHHARLYGLALALVVFFLGWAVVAAHPWATTANDPRLRVLAVREAQLRREAQVVRHVVAARWAHYRVQLKLRRAQIASASAAAAAAATAAASQQVAAGPVQIVSLPAHVVTRTS